MSNSKVGGPFIYRPQEGRLPRFVEFRNYKELLNAKVKEGLLFRSIFAEVRLKGYREEKTGVYEVKITLDLSIILNGQEVALSEATKYWEEEAVKKLFHAVKNRIPDIAEDVEMIEDNGRKALLIKL